MVIFARETFAGMCHALDKRLEQNSSKLFIAGNELSIADFAYASRYFNFV